MSKRILVVEDQPDSRQIIRDMLAVTDPLRDIIFFGRDLSRSKVSVERRRRAIHREHP